ncbi:MAG: DUF4145 domain-containing protein [Gammaproteobacteria bacterium]
MTHKIAKPHKLSSEDRKIVLDLFARIERPNKGVEAVKYRAEREEYIESLDRLERWGYIRRDNNRYLISLAAINQFKTKGSHRLLLNCEAIFNYLRNWYKVHITAQVKLTELADHLGLSLPEIQEALSYLVEASWWSGMATDIFSPDAYIAAAEGILRYKSFSDVVNELQNYRTANASNKGMPPFSLYNSQLNEFSGGDHLSPVSSNVKISIDKLPKKIANIMREIYLARDLGLRALPTMGVRAVIDAVAQKYVGDIGGFEEKIKALEQRGYIKQVDTEILLTAVEVGSASIHRSHLPPKSTVDLCIDIVGHLLESVYVLQPASRAVRKKTPVRRKKSRHNIQS